jgi:hypothetical protein
MARRKAARAPGAWGTAARHCQEAAFAERVTARKTPDLSRLLAPVVQIDVSPPKHSAIASERTGRGLSGSVREVRRALLAAFIRADLTARIVLLYVGATMQRIGSQEGGMPGDGDNEELAVMPEDAIATALDAARGRVVRAERERAELDRTIAAAREEERLLERLLALRRGGTAGTDHGAVAGHHVSPSRAMGETKHPALQAVIEELETAGRPLHISELMRLLKERKVSIPGSGTQANLITHLRRDDRLIRPSRGMYGLAAWGLEAMPAVRRTRRRRKRLRSTTAERRNQA